ncbi:hypothetical protein WEI85_47305 [Actinomycetes bacterium KLBMP 9797]
MVEVGRADQCGIRLDAGQEQGVGVATVAPLGALVVFLAADVGDAPVAQLQ